MIALIISTIIIAAFLLVVGLLGLNQFFRYKDRRDAALDAQYSTEVQYREQNKLLEQAIAKERAEHDRAKAIQNITEESEWGAIPYDEWIAAETAAVANNTVAKETSYTAEDTIKRAYRAAAKARGEDYLEDWIKAEVAKHKPSQVTDVEENYTELDKIKQANALLRSRAAKKAKRASTHVNYVAAWKAFTDAEKEVAKASEPVGRNKDGTNALIAVEAAVAKYKIAWRDLQKASAKDDAAAITSPKRKLKRKSK